MGVEAELQKPLGEVQSAEALGGLGHELVHGGPVVGHPVALLLEELLQVAGVEDGEGRGLLKAL